MSSTGQIVGGVVGAVVGFFVGGPTGALYGAQLGIMAGGLIDPAKVQGPRLDDLAAQTSTYGAFIPRIYGTVAVHGNVMWIQGDRLIERSSTASGKGGPDVESFDYFATFAVSLCEGPIAGVRRIWVGGQLWYDAGSDDINTIIASGEKAGMFTVYTGSETQEPDPLIQADRGAANVPAYRGLAYIVFDGLPLKDVGNSLAGAQIKVEVVKDGDFVIPDVLATTAYTGYLTYAEPGFFQTAEMGTGRFETIDGVNYYIGAATFRDYAYDGRVLNIRTLEHKIVKSPSNSSLSFHLTLPVYGRRYGFWVAVTDKYRISVYPLETELQLASTHIGTESAGKPYGYFRGSYWFPSSSNGLKIPPTMTSYEAFYISVGNPDYQSVIVRGDPTTGRTFVKWKDASTSVNYFGEFDPSGTPETLLWYQAIGSGTAAGSAANNFFEVYKSHLINAVSTVEGDYPTGSVSIYAVGALGLTLVGKVPNTAGSRNANGIGSGLAYVGNTLFNMLAKIQAFPADLADIVETECLKSELLTAADLDVTDLDAEVRGYRIGSLGPLRGGVDPLRTAWPFDAVQHGYQIKFKARGGASVATISEAELDAREAGTGPGVQVTNVREMDTVLPSQLTLKYLDVAREYDINVAEQTR